MPLSLLTFSLCFGIHPFWVKVCFLVFETTRGHFPTVFCLSDGSSHPDVSFSFLHIFSAVLVTPSPTSLYTDRHICNYLVYHPEFFFSDNCLELVTSWHFFYWQNPTSKKPRMFRTRPSIPQHLPPEKGPHSALLPRAGRPKLEGANKTSSSDDARHLGRDPCSPVLRRIVGFSFTAFSSYFHS